MNNTDMLQNLIDKKYDNVVSISHTDLDGYASQMLFYKLGKKHKVEISMFNTGYGKDLENLLCYIDRKYNKNETKNLLIITDINIDNYSFNKIKYLDTFDVLIIDHHQTTIEEPLPQWFLLDTTMSATKASYNFLLDFDREFLYYSEVVEIVNVLDMWLEDDKLFEKAKYLNNTLFKYMYIFPQDMVKFKRKLLFYLIETMGKFVHSQKDFYQIEKRESSILREFIFFEDYQEDRFLPSKTLLMNFIAKHRDIKTANREVTINGLKGILFFNDIEIFQELSHIYLKELDFDFAIHINKTGKISLRSIDDNNNVNAIAKQYFNGGGHIQASGGMVETERLRNIDEALDTIINTTNNQY
jgi:oligoribonuclease NrnB/cAMP/cGMP phosphodiesterase (DHH superfamily)